MKLRNTIASRALAALAVCTLACSPAFGTVEFESVSTPPVNVTVRGFFIEMPAGIAAVVRATPLSDSATDYDSGHRVDLISQDRDVFRVERRPSRREFVFVGINPGSTCVEVRIDGRPEDCIEVEITEPEI